MGYTKYLLFFFLLLPMIGCETDNDLLVKLPFSHARSDRIPGILPPRDRIEMIRKKGEYGSRAEPNVKAQLLEQLTEEYTTVPDPAVRNEVILAVEKLNANGGIELVKLATKDESALVRRTACRVIGYSKADDAAFILRVMLKSDTDQDVRLQAAESLGAFRDAETITALGGALEDKHIAIQYRAMQSLKQCTGQDYGNDAYRWKEYLAGESVTPPPPKNIAERIGITRLPMF
ncbi:MAG: HEAT repeat domain-containing protein [Planctomycetaceae bacterium]|nr:HEAT repeat domain-containing protein [Planctomycetaceae bacterium]